MKPFEMMVRDTFRMEGMTMFMGFISPDIEFIRACDCEVVANGNVVAVIHIEGEGHPEAEDPNQRSIGTRDAIDLTSLGLGSRGFIIRLRRTAN